MKYSVMIIVDASSREEAIEKRCQGTVHAVGEVHQIERPERKPIEPEPWPILLLPLKALAKEGDKGAGDIIARTIGPIGGDAFKVWYKKLFGKDCGCGSRQEVLNLRWPL